MITRPYALAGLASGEGQEGVLAYVYEWFSKAALGTITRPYAHAGVASGEGQEGDLAYVYLWFSKRLIIWKPVARRHGHQAFRPRMFGARRSSSG